MTLPHIFLDMQTGESTKKMNDASGACEDCENDTCELNHKELKENQLVSPQEDLLDSKTFALPLPGVGSPNSVVIEFCVRCGWLHRASWTLTELLVTFGPTKDRTENVLSAVTLSPCLEPAGKFRVWLYTSKNDTFYYPQAKKTGGAVLIYDRKLEGGFPELKELKQRIRNIIAPGKSLGHSDTKPVELITQTLEASSTASAADYEPRFKC